MVLSLFKLILTGAVGQIAPAVAQLLRATLLQPYVLGAAVHAAWALARDLALSGLACCLCYAAIRAMLAGERPWELLARAALAAIGAEFSLDLVSWLLSLNNRLVLALAGPAGTGVDRSLLAPLGALAGSTLDLLPAVVGLVVAAGGFWIALTYFLRAAEIVLLALLAPFAAVVAVVPAGAGAWRALVAELVPAVFMQAAQALVLSAFIAFTAPVGSSAGLGGLMTALVSLLLLGRVRGLLRSFCQAPAAAAGAAVQGYLLARYVPGLNAARRLVGG